MRAAPVTVLPLKRWMTLSNPVVMTDSSASSAIDQIINAMPEALPAVRRFVIAIAAPPAAGKSTLAEELRLAMAPKATVLGMDAFHFDDAILRERGDLPRKGAPHTFDVDGYRRMLTTLRNEPDCNVAMPRFDRSLELSRGSAELATADERIVITEGNYLLLDQAPWTELRPLFDLTVMLSQDIATIEARILQRWADHGFAPAEARARFELNDGPNARLVLEHSSPAQIHL